MVFFSTRLKSYILNKSVIKPCCRATSDTGIHFYGIHFHFLKTHGGFLDDYTMTLPQCHLEPRNGMYNPCGLTKAITGPRTISLDDVILCHSLT